MMTDDIKTTTKQLQCELQIEFVLYEVAESRNVVRLPEVWKHLF
jgi:hypothetical protein